MKSIFLKLFITYLVILFGSFLILIAVSFLLFDNEFDNQFRNYSVNQINSVIEFINKAKSNGWDEEIIKSSIVLDTTQDDKVFYLYDKDGKLLYGIGNLQLPLNNSQLVAEILNEKQFIRKFVTDNDSKQRLFLSGTYINNYSNMDEKVIIMASFGFEKSISSIRKLLLLSIVISISATALSVYFFSKRLTAPIREMNQAALKIAKGDFSKRVNTKSGDEIGQLSDSFNHMAEELAGLDKMRKEFVANVSHDMRTPLTSIQGFLGALIDGTIPKEKQTHYYLIMKEQTERLIKLVNDLLDVARIEAGQMSIDPVSFNLSELIRRIIARLEPELNKNNIQIQLIADSDEDIFVYADPDRIEQVIFNLIHNATQFSKDNGQIDVELRKREKAVISIRDYGQGIEENDLKHIFKRFYKADKARTKIAGTGIGLSIVKHILDLHNEKIDVKSRINEGTAFIFSLPISKK